MSVQKNIKAEIERKRPGDIMFTSDFIEFGNYEVVRKSLQRLAISGKIIRLSHGLYYYPKYDKILGLVYPSVDRIGIAIAKRDKARIVPSGAYALYLLGLSTQVPMNVVYLTDGSPRKVQIGKQSILFKKASPKNLEVKNHLSGLVIQALKAIGQRNVSVEQKRKIKELIIASNQSQELSKDTELAPAWIRKIVRSIIEEIEDEQLA